MGLGLFLRASVRREHRTGLSSIDTSIIDRLEHEAHSFAKSHGLDALLSSEREDENGIWLGFHPGEEAVECRYEGDQLVVSARTSSVGPGYHAYVVDFLDHLQRQLGLEWTTGGPPGDEGDETDFFVSRDFAALQKNMAVWLRALAGSFADVDQTLHYAVCLNLHLSPTIQGEARISGPRGPIDFDLMHRIRQAEDTTLDQYAKDWFVWPNREPDAKFWARTGEVLVWQRVPWHAPLDAGEREVYRLALRCFDHARSLDPELPLPELAIKELRQFEQSPIEDAPKPLPAGPGYWRQILRRPLPDDWSIVIPGYWYFTQDDDGLRYWFDDAVIWATTFTFELKDGSSKQLNSEDLPSDGGEIEKLQADGVVGRLHFFVRAPDEDSRYLLRAYAINGCSQLMLSCFFSREDDIDRMRALLKSIRRATPE